MGKANDKRSYSITAGNPEISKSVVYCSLGGITVVPNADLATFACGGTIVASPPIGGGTGGDGDDDGDDGGGTIPTANGMLAGWGWASNYQIGNGPLPTTTNYGPFHNKTVTQLNTEGTEGCALADGVLWCWSGASGFNPVNQQVSGLLAGKTVTAISTGFNYTCVIADGDAYCHGKNNYGQLGSGMAVSTNATSGATYVAVSKSGVMSGKTLKAINAGSQHACAVATDNSVFCWGRNAFGALGNGNQTSSNVPVAVVMTGALAGVTIQKVETSTEGTCVLDTLGRVYCWGLGSTTGTYGTGTNSPGPSMNFEWVPVRAGDKGPLVGKTVTQLDATPSRICVVANDNLQYCWGNALSVAANTPSLSMLGLPAGETVKRLSSTCLFMTDNKSYCYLNSAVYEYTQLSGTNTLPVSGMLITDISENCFMIDGQPWCSTSPWAGTSIKVSRDVVVTLSKYLVPMAVGGNILDGKDITQVTAGGSHSCGATKTEMYCWGRNANGQLGDGTATNAEWPVKVQGLSGDITSIAAGKTSTCAIANELPYCWGNGYAGQLGNGDTTPRSTPTLVTGALAGKPLKEIGAGEDFACALGTDGKVYCWGTGYAGQLGNGGVEETNASPVVVAGVLAGKTVTDIDVGPYNVCAVADGAPYCWGANWDEQFDDSYVDALLPIAQPASGRLSRQ
jgi:alpha-tubulin suppressor-like RCC1 family protein